ncbi:hypothetical protein BFP97_19175 [Roseivirga sp. 4D4]|uniref:hypothetical protein n=1 Tax=Roseivirga sp. 4D4 TaxID=1889784 RepID=UPI0008539719|nr:hypothetical protein [Roseivirga sp. 4D4]OEK03512.1 hypothetical protein BFP97_19175 [Roseivirga sp. 4D4]
MSKLLFKLFRGSLLLFSCKLGLFCTIIIVSSCTQEDSNPTDLHDSEAVIRFTNSITGSFAHDIIRPEANFYHDELTEEDARILLNPLMSESIEFLLALGFEENEIEDELGGSESPTTLAVAFVFLEHIRMSEATAINFTDIDTFLFNQAYAYDGDVLPCLGEAFGFAAVGYILQEGIEAAIAHYGTRGLLRVLGRAAGRTLGWVGAALAAYEFAQCLKY